MSSSPRSDRAASEARSEPKASEVHASPLWRFLFTPVDIASLAVFRIGFGLLMAKDLFTYLENGSVKELYIDPRFHFTWGLFDWVRPWPATGMYLHFYALIALALCIAAGLFHRVSAALFCVGFSYVFLLEKAIYLNHWYLVCLLSFLLIFLPAHRALSADAWLRPGLRSEQAPAWALWLVRSQMGVVYFFGGIAKLNPDWLRGLSMRIGLPGSIGLPGLAPLLAHPATALFTSWAGMAIDLLMVPALLWRRTRPFAFAVGVSFHLLNSQMFEIGVFPWLAIWCTVTFFDADWPRRVFNWPRSGTLSSATPVRWDARSRATAALLATYVAIQLLVPLRHFLYPGNTGWTEIGDHFSWRMKLNSKTGLARFRLTDPATGRTWEVDPSQELTTLQTKRMASDPFLLLGYAHHLAALVTRPGEPRVEVRAISVVTMNGHPAEPMIDPGVDLAAVPNTLFAPTHWILPQNNELGRRLRATLPEASRDAPGQAARPSQ